MKPLAQILVVGLLLPAVPVAAQEAAPDRNAVVVISREAIRHAVVASAPSRVQAAGPRSDWLSVRALPPGAEIVLTMDGTPAVVGRFVRADESAVVVLKSSAIVGDDARRLVKAASAHPERFAAALAGPEVFADELKIGPDGVYFGGRRAADLDVVLVRIPRDRVAGLTAAGPWIRSGKGAVLGAAVGATLGVLSALHFAYKDCGGNCVDEGIMIYVSVIGMPVGGGIAGYYGLGHRGPGVVYRRR